MATVVVQGDEVRRLRSQYYNAQLLEVKQSHDELRIFRIRPDRSTLLARYEAIERFGLDLLIAQNSLTQS